MYPGLFASFDGNERESDDNDTDRDDSSTFSDREEIEQALYAQIHYCQVEGEDEKHIDLDGSATKQNIYSTSDIQIEDKQFELRTHSGKKSNSQDDTHITISSSTEDSSSKIKKSLKSHSEKAKTKTDLNEVITIDTQSDSDAISISSDLWDETGYSSDSSFVLSSDCMALDESCDDMGDIVVNVDKNQRKMLNHLTVRDIKEKDKAGKWTIIDQDRFQGNPLLGRYYRTSSVRCHNCNEVGHLSKVCPQPRKEIVCYLCGEEGHHGRACTNPICFNCNAPGHVFAKCTAPKRSQRMECYRCEMFGHASYECPEIWRQFHLTTIFGTLYKGKQKENKKRHCPNCAGDDHFDYECEEERMDRHGLPICPLIKQYRKADLKSQKRCRERLDDESDIPKKRPKNDKLNTSRNNIHYEEDFDRTISCVKKNESKKKKSSKKSFKEKLRDYEEDFDRTCSSVKNIASKKKKSSKKSFKEKLRDFNSDYASHNNVNRKSKKDASSKKRKNQSFHEDSEYGNFSNKKLKNKSLRLQKNNDTKKKDKKKTKEKKRTSNIYDEQLKLRKKKKKMLHKEKKANNNSNFAKNRGFKMSNGLFEISFKNTVL